MKRILLIGALTTVLELPLYLRIPSLSFQLTMALAFVGAGLLSVISIWGSDRVLRLQPKEPGLPTEGIMKWALAVVIIAVAVLCSALVFVVIYIPLMSGVIPAIIFQIVIPVVFLLLYGSLIWFYRKLPSLHEHFFTPSLKYEDRL